MMKKKQNTQQLLKAMIICLFHYQHFQTGQFNPLVFLEQLCY